MKKLSLAVLATLAAVLLAPGTIRAEVVRPAPAFTCIAGKSLKSFKGQPVILIFAPSPRSGAFRKQAQRIQAAYQGFASRNAVFIAVFTDSEAAAGGRIPSNVPFILADDGAKVAAAYGFDGKFNLCVVGRDGNLDLTTSKVVPASRIMDAIYNNAEQQTAERKL
jgi:peroxiredoxin